MSDEDFDSVFGRRPERPNFSERVARGEAFGGRVDPHPAMAVEAASTDPVPGEYRAFGISQAGNLNSACEVRRWIDGTEVPEGRVFFYRLLMQIGFSATDELRLMLPDTVIILGGSNLDPLRQALMRGQATFIQQWSKQVWRAAPATGEPIIRSIEFLRPGDQAT